MNPNNSWCREYGFAPASPKAPEGKQEIAVLNAKLKNIEKRFETEKQLRSDLTQERRANAKLRKEKMDDQKKIERMEKEIMALKVALGKEKKANKILEEENVKFLRQHVKSLEKEKEMKEEIESLKVKRVGRGRGRPRGIRAVRRTVVPKIDEDEL